MSLEFNTLIKRIFFNWHVKIVSVSAAVLLLVINRMINIEENVLAVPLTVRLNDGFSAATTLARDTVNVTVRGDKELGIGKISQSDIIVIADLTPYVKEDTYRIKLLYEKKGAANTISPLSVSIEPPEITMAIEKTMQKSVGIEAVIKAGPPDGYDYSYTIVPGNVLITGPSTKVESIETVKTEAIDLSGKTENFTLQIKLATPDPLVAFKESGQAEFRCIINQVIVETAVEARIEVANLGGRLRIESRLPASGSLDLKISPERLESLSREDVALVVDCSNIRSEGKYTIGIKPVAPEGVVVVRYSPEEITIDVSGY